MDSNQLNKELKALKSLTDLWTFCCKLNQCLLLDFQSLESQVQKDYRMKA